MSNVWDGWENESGLENLEFEGPLRHPGRGVQQVDCDLSLSLMSEVGAGEE